MKIIEREDFYAVVTARFDAKEHVEIRDFPKHWPNLRAKIATEMVSKWAMLAVESDGEDSAGRAKLRSMPPADVVNRSVETADLLVAQFEARGWLIPGVNPSEVYGGDEE